MRSRVMRPESWVFCDTGADDEITAKDNVTAWRKLKLRPRVLRDIVEVDTSVSLLGAQGEDADHGGADRPASSVPRRTASARPRAARRRPARSIVMSTSGATLVEDVAKERGARAAMVPALHAARPRGDRRAARPLRQGGLQGAGAHRRSAGAGLEPARRAHAGDRRRQTCAASTWSASRSRAPPTIRTARAW